MLSTVDRSTATTTRTATPAPLTDAATAHVTSLLLKIDAELRATGRR